MSNKQLRTIIRAVHMVAGVMLFALVYVEAARASVAYLTLVQIVVIPVVAFSGVAMWQQAALSRLRRKGAPKAVRAPAENA